MGMFGRFRPRGGDSSTMARGDASGLVPSTGGMGRPPRPPFRTTVGFMGPDNPGNFGPHSPRDESGDRGYGSLPKRPERGAKDPDSLPKRPNPHERIQPEFDYNQPLKPSQAAPWDVRPKKDSPDSASEKKPLKDTPSETPKKKGKTPSYNQSTAPYQTTDEWASSVARRKGWVPD